MNDHNHNPDLPEGLRDLETSLDALGERARSSAPGGLGERIATAGTEIITSPRPGERRLSGSQAGPNQRTGWRQHWPLAASVALLVVAVVAAISLLQPQPITGPMVDADTEFIDDDWIEFETTYAADTGWDDDAFEALENELDALELSFNTAWTLDENLNLNEGESL